MTQITIAMQAGAKPTVITLLDGKARVGSRNQFISYPAIQFPGLKEPIALIEDGLDSIRPSKSRAAAEKLAARMVKDVVAKAKAKLAKTGAKG